MAKMKTVSGKSAWRFAELPKSIAVVPTDAKLYGSKELVWPAVEVQLKWTKREQESALHKGFNWYNGTSDHKVALKWATEFMARNPRRKKWHTALVNANPDDLPQVVGFMCRMGRMGLVLRPYMLRAIIKYMNQLVYKQELNKKKKPEETVTEDKAVPKFNIQERLQEKYLEAMGELEGRFDSFIFENNYKGEPKVVEVLTAGNIHVQKMKDAIELYEKKLRFWKWLSTTKDPQYLEAYSRFGKRDYNKIIAWLEQALADFRSYETIKKVNRKVRVKKAVPPEKKVSKLQFLKEFAELKLKSIDPVDILTASELWVYDTAKRKLGLYVADPHVTKLDVKGAKILGFDTSQSVQKRLRKPAEQLKTFDAAGKPASKKWFKGVRSVETTLKGRITKDMVLLKAFK